MFYVSEEPGQLKASKASLAGLIHKVLTGAAGTNWESGPEASDKRGGHGV